MIAKLPLAASILLLAAANAPAQEELNNCLPDCRASAAAKTGDPPPAHVRVAARLAPHQKLTTHPLSATSRDRPVKSAPRIGERHALAQPDSGTAEAKR